MPIFYAILFAVSMMLLVVGFQREKALIFMIGVLLWLLLVGMLWNSFEKMIRYQKIERVRIKHEELKDGEFILEQKNISLAYRGEC